MQKKLIALAVAGLVSGAAFADSNVTVYGVADVSFDVVQTSGGALAGGNTGSYTKVTSNNSYLGFKGSEDLGNGHKAVFQIENQIGYDTAPAGAGVFGTARDTYAGLVGGYGAITLGTQTGPTRALGVAMDVNPGATSVGDNKSLIGRSGFDSRLPNSAAYTSPTFSGFNGVIAYSTAENKTTDGNAAKLNGKAWDLGLNYANGPIVAGLTYADSKAGDVANSETKNTRLAGSYNFGQGSVRLLWNSTKVDTNTTEAKQNVWGLGGTFNVAANGKLIAQYYKANDVTGNLGGSATGAKLFELGYEHSLSKRTIVHAIYARVDNDSNTSAFNFASPNAVANVAGDNGINASAFQVGIRHSF